MRTEQKREKQVSNRTDSSVSVDERQIKESRGGWQRSLPLPDLSRKIEGPLLAGHFCAYAIFRIKHAVKNISLLASRMPVRLDFFLQFSFST